MDRSEKRKYVTSTIALGILFCGFLGVLLSEVYSILLFRNRGMASFAKVQDVDSINDASFAVNIVFRMDSNLIATTVKSSQHLGVSDSIRIYYFEGDQNSIAVENPGEIRGNVVLLTVFVISLGALFVGLCRYPTTVLKYFTSDNW
jgi:hypothetical protein